MTLADLCIALKRWLDAERIDLSCQQHTTLSVYGTRKRDK